MEKSKMESKDNVQDNIKKIEALFSDAITECEGEDGKITKGIDFDKLRQMLSKDIIDSNSERYEFTWVGKNQAIIDANTPIRKTLRPCIEESKNFDTTENLYIEGDNLNALKLLQESYLGEVKMIYIDPPYNTGNDSFVYSDKFAMNKDDYEENIEYRNENDEILFKQNNDSNPKFHSDWCSMIYSRLRLAKNLLKEDGVIFISIDDNEVRNLRNICDEIFGECNFISQSIRRTINSGKHDTKTIAPFHEYLLIYSKNINCLNLAKKEKSKEEKEKLYKLSDEYIEERGKYYITQLNKNSIQYSDSLNFPIKDNDGNEIFPGKGFDDKEWCWRWGQDKVKWGLENGFIVFDNNKVYTKSYELVDNEGDPVVRSNPYSSLEFIAKDYCNFKATPELSQLFGGKKYFNFPKSTNFIKEIIKLANINKDDIVLDFFSGSSTTADAVMQLNAEDDGNRKFIMVQLPEKTDDKTEAFKSGYTNICEIGKERIRRAGQKIEDEINEQNKQITVSGESKKVPDTGFRVLKVNGSNMKDIYYSANDVDQTTLGNTVSNIEDGVTGLDLLFGVLIDLGLKLSHQFDVTKIDEIDVYNYKNGSLIACLGDKIVSQTCVKEIAGLNPKSVVFRDSCFENSTSKINLEEIFKTISSSTEIKVI